MPAAALQLAASKKKGTGKIRSCISSLYQLAVALRRVHGSAGSSSSSSLPLLVYHAPRLETSEEKGITTEQVWGQMSVLLRPSLRRLQDRVRQAEKAFRDVGGAATAGSGKRAAPSKKERKKVTWDPLQQGDDDDDDDDDEEEEQQLEGDDEDPSLSDMSEGELDEEIAALLEKRKEQIKKRKGEKGPAAAGAGEDEDWRYAFGRGQLDEEDDEEVGEDGEKRIVREESTRRRRRGDDEGGRPPRPVGDGDDEEDEDDEDPTESLQALRELYGDDYEDDGQGFLDGDEEGDDAAMNEEEEEEDEENTRPYQPEPFTYFGGEDMLDQNQSALFEDEEHHMGSGRMEGEEGTEEKTDEVEKALLEDEELQTYLQREDVSDFSKQAMYEKKRVLVLEQRRLYGTEKSWQMTGESSAHKRPREALLELDQLDFEYGMKAAPIITEGVTQKLEERIKQRILEKQFDDVQPKSLMTDSSALSTTRRDVVSESEKSKSSLMDLYEKEYTAKLQRLEEGGAAAAEATPLTEIERDELRAIQMWKRLAQHLDSLSNFHYTPKPVREDLEARVRATEQQLPALQVEHVGNFAVSREMALAPQDLYRPSTKALVQREGPVGSAELNPRERKAVRRDKKQREGVRRKIVEQHRGEKKAAAAAAATKS